MPQSSAERKKPEAQRSRERRAKARAEGTWADMQRRVRELAAEKLVRQQDAHAKQIARMAAKKRASQYPVPSDPLSLAIFNMRKLDEHPETP